MSGFERNGRKFLSSWYDKHNWLTLCTKQQKVFCTYCQFAKTHNLLQFSTRGDSAFTSTGFNNYKKAMEKFAQHAASATHQEAVMKCSAIAMPSIQTMMSTQLAKQQHLHRAGLLKQLSAMRFLLRQGLALRGHHHTDGNLYQLLCAWASDCDIVKDWVKQGRFMSHDHVNELIKLMGHAVLRKVLARIQSNDPAWFSIIADEATDVSCAEQLNISIRYVDDQYIIHEDSIGLFQLSSTDAATITHAIKDILVRTSLPLSLCRGQAYDGAATMQGKRSGVATRLKEEEPAAVPVHCLAHSLNLCLQDAARSIVIIRDSMDIVREIVKLINYSPKRKALFASKLCEQDQQGSSIKPLCPTRWTVRTAALESVLNQYNVVMDTMEEVNQTTRDDYGLKAGGVLSSLQKFGTLFGLRLAHLLFSAAEETSKFLQGKDTNVQEALSSVGVLKCYFQRQRTDDQFNAFYDATESHAHNLEIDPPALPRYRRQPRRFCEGSETHRHESPRDFYRQIYNEACDLLVQEVTDRFNQDFMKPLAAMEKLLLSAANGKGFTEEIDAVACSVFAKDLDMAKLARHLAVLPDIVHQALPDVKEVTTIRTVCSAMSFSTHRSTFNEVHKLLRLYLTVPITSSTSERAFSTLKRLLTYLRSSMTEQRLNNCALIHIHKDIVDNMDLLPIALAFTTANDDRLRYFGSFQ